VGLNNERDWAVVHQFDVHVSRKAARATRMPSAAMRSATLCRGIGPRRILGAVEAGRLPLRMEPASVN